ncbi:DUF6895 family protein [Aquimarina algiphila]|uniref:DUF6895 family protein n=1 Tax=Aquimarina algiphila TaxID=2047982 RepID=UPI00232C983A|nr:hypothetical protein [Aquimarina algiphila]
MNRLYTINERNTRLEALLDWIINNIKDFQTPIEFEVSSDSPEKITPGIKRKAFIELGLAIRLAQRKPQLKKHPKLRKLVKLWIENIENSSFFFDIKRRIQLFPHRVVSYSVLASLGIQNKKVFNELQSLLDRGYLDSVERSAWDKLDMKYYIEAAGLKHRFSNNENLLLESSLNNLPPIAYVQNYDLYGITHLLFHFSNFGVVNMKTFLGNSYDKIQNYIDLAISLSMVRQDWDLNAELLINQYCLNKTFSSFDKMAAKELMMVQQPTGFIPGREWIRNKHQENRCPKSYTFEDVYHPTIVCLILLICEFDD